VRTASNTTFVSTSTTVSLRATPSSSTRDYPGSS
jgi:hypothetical protein